MKEKKPKSIKFIYNKTPNYRTYTVGGIVGGLTPKGKLFIDLFNEKRALPDSVIHELSEEGLLGKEIERKVNDGVIREIDCGIYLDIDVAVVISDWLNERIKEFNNLARKRR